MNKTTFAKTKKFTALALLTALIVVLQILSSFVHFGPVNISLALAPIIIGAALYGCASGAFLGFVMGVVVFVSGILGWDGGFVLMLMDKNAVATVVLCLLKSTAAGYFAAIVYKLINRKNKTVAVVTSGIVCPVVNTGLFIVGMFAFFFTTVKEMAAGENMLYFMVVGVAGINFIIELVVNVVLSSAITRIVQILGKNKA